MEIHLDEIIRRFAKLHPRRMELTNILSARLRNPGKGTSGSENPKTSCGSMPGLPLKLAPSVLV